MTVMAASGGSSFYIPSYLDDSDGSKDFKAFADSMAPDGPVRFRDVADSHRVSKGDLDWALRFTATGTVVIPRDSELARDRVPDGGEVAVVNLSEGRVVIQPEPGVLVGGDDRLVVNPWKVGVLVKNGANFWLLSLGNGAGGDSKNVPLPPGNAKAFGTAGGVVLTWEKPKDDGGSPITSYIVQQLKGAEFVDVKTTLPTALSTEIDDLTVGQSFTFRVKAANAVGFSEPSAEVSATPTNTYNDATGGVPTTYESGGKYYRVHTFTSSDKFTVSGNANPFNVLVVGAGGGGGAGGTGADNYNNGDGGDGGNVYQAPGTLIPLGDSAVTIGGGFSKFLNYTAADGKPGAGGDGAGRSRNGTPIPGTTSSITGSPVEYGRAGLGDGSSASGQQPGDGGSGGPHHQGAKAGGAGKPGVVIVSYEIAPFNDATGGIPTVVENYNGTGQKWKIHTFKSSAELIVKSATKPFRVLCIAGGGGGAGSGPYNGGGGGGGAGGFLFKEEMTVPTGTYQVTVGQGGSGGVGQTGGAGQGGSSQIGDLNAVGGGAGQAYQAGGSGGGSGGGSYNWQNSQYPGTPGQGYNGGPGEMRTDQQGVHLAGPGGGGGGAGGAGVTYSGGPGKASDITGASVVYSTGGGTGRETGAPNTGNGGGGTTDGTGGTGGSGVVIVGYQIG
jgi:Fibronectin type III domain